VSTVLAGATQVAIFGAAEPLDRDSRRSHDKARNTTVSAGATQVAISPAVHAASTIADNARRTRVPILRIGLPRRGHTPHTAAGNGQPSSPGGIPHRGGFAHRENT